MCVLHIIEYSTKYVHDAHIFLPNVKTAPGQGAVQFYPCMRATPALLTPVAQDKTPPPIVRRGSLSAIFGKLLIYTRLIFCQIAARFHIAETYPSPRPETWRFGKLPLRFDCSE